MKYQLALCGCLLLLFTLTDIASAQDGDTGITVTKTSDGIKMICKGKNKYWKDTEETSEYTLEYQDVNSGEYTCGDSSNEEKIYVKFRSCDNCIELDTGSVIGMVIGNVVATVIIGVAVYLLASKEWISPNTSMKKSSDRQHLVPHEGRSRGPNEHYEPLRAKGVQKDTYDVITSRK